MKDHGDEGESHIHFREFGCVFLVVADGEVKGLVQTLRTLSTGSYGGNSSVADTELTTSRPALDLKAVSLGRFPAVWP